MEAKKLKIALVSKSNGCLGGASFFAENLGGWLAAAGHEVTQFCVEPRQELRAFQRPLPVTSLASRLVRHGNWRARQWGVVERLPWEFWFGLAEQSKPFDLVHFHDLYRAISPRTLECVAKQKPVVFTVHDCSAFTGGCLYPMNCRRYEEACGSCPNIAGIGRFDFTRSNLKTVRRLARARNVHYAFPSRWIQTEASRSLKFGGESVHIPNGFGSGAYAYQQRAQARTALGLDQTKKIVAVSSASLDDHRKGIIFAIRALMANRDLGPHVVVVGRTSSTMTEALQGLDFTLAGFVTERSRLGLFYAAADLLLFPSLADNLPITIQEAMAAGTPVLAFDVGGVPELVRPGHTGWLVPAGDQAALNRQLREILDGNETAVMGERARKMIEDEYSVARCVERHVSLYRHILGNS